MKTCPKCQVTKPLTGFHKDRTKASGHMSHCKDCDNAKRKQSYQANRGTVLARFAQQRQADRDGYNRRAREYRRASFLANPDRYRERDRARYMKRHGGSDEWARMFAEQDGRCYLCLQPLPKDGEFVHVDHDHSCCPGTRANTRSCTACRRGLVHRACNQIWGLAHENPDLLRTMAEQGEQARELARQRIEATQQQQILL